MARLAGTLAPVRSARCRRVSNHGVRWSRRRNRPAGFGVRHIERRVAPDGDPGIRGVAADGDPCFRRVALDAAPSIGRRVAPDGGPWVDGVCPELLIHHAPRPATSNALPAPIAMRRRARLPKEIRRIAPGPLLTEPDIGRELVPLVRAAGWAGRRLRHIEQTPWSPGSGVYKAPQLVHPSTEVD